MNAEAAVIQELAEIPQGRKIEDFLKEIDYSIKPGYCPSDFALGFVAFIKLVNGEEGEENKTPLAHFYMLDTLANSKGNVANLCCRGSAKTTLCGEYLILYLALYGKMPGFSAVNLVLYVSDSIENGVKNMRKNLEHRWENSEFLQQYIPTIKLTDIRWEFRNVDGKKLVVKGYGAATGVRGAKEMGTRPQLAILDDLVSDEDARSPTIIAAIEDTVYKAVAYALHPKQSRMIWSGTPFNANDPLYKAVESGAWVVNVFPACEAFPCAKQDFVSIWPDRFTYDYVLKKYNDSRALGRIDTFNAELMLRIMSDEDRMIKDSEILWYSLKSLERNKGRFNYYITTDFATSKNTSADFSIICVWAYNNRGDWFLVDGICKRQLMNENMDDLFRLAQKWNPQLVGIEISGQQSAFISWIMSEMLDRNVYFSLASDRKTNEPGIRPNTDKLKRFNAVQPLFAAHKMYFPAELRETVLLQEAINELQLVSKGGFKSKHDDFLDAVSMLGLLDAFKPSTDDIEMEQKLRGNMNIWEHAPEEPDSWRIDSYVA